MLCWTQAHSTFFSAYECQENMEEGRWMGGNEPNNRNVSGIEILPTFLLYGHTPL